MYYVYIIYIYIYITPRTDYWSHQMFTFPTSPTSVIGPFSNRSIAYYKKVKQIMSLAPQRHCILLKSDIFMILTPQRHCIQKSEHFMILTPQRHCILQTSQHFMSFTSQRHYILQKSETFMILTPQRHCILQTSEKIMSLAPLSTLLILWTLSALLTLLTLYRPLMHIRTSLAKKRPKAKV